MFPGLKQTNVDCIYVGKTRLTSSQACKIRILTLLLGAHIVTGIPFGLVKWKIDERTCGNKSNQLGAVLGKPVMSNEVTQRVRAVNGEKACRRTAKRRGEWCRGNCGYASAQILMLYKYFPFKYPSLYSISNYLFRC